MEFSKLLEKRQFVFLILIVILAVIALLLYLLYSFSKPRNPKPGEEVTYEEKMDILNYLSEQKKEPEVSLSEKKRVIEALSRQSSEISSGEYQFGEEGKLQILKEVESVQ